MRLFTLLFMFVVGLNASAQDSTLGFNFAQIEAASDTSYTLNFKTLKKGKLVVHQDKRVDNITTFISRQKESIDGPKIDGYRIQIFFAESRTVAQSQKANFMSSHSEHRAYIDYLAPNYRVRVGNFRTKLEAEKLKQELISVYPTCIVLKDKIDLPVLPTVE